jgi:3-hydroxybutyryl-CoA dehydrogenase
MEIKRVGVVGCGTMGSGIVLVCAQSGYEVVTSEINDELLKKGLATINAFLTKSVEKGKVTNEEKEATLARIRGTTSMQDFSGCDLVIEAAIEDIELKKKIFNNLNKVCPESAILASNTSCLSIIDMAMATTRPEKVLGLHFFNPAAIMKLLEIVNTIATSGETLEVAKRFGKSLGKNIVVTKDCPGFIANRLAMVYLLESIRMLESGVATREDIDTTMTLGFGHPMGPLTLSDLIGLDVILRIANSMFEETKDTKYAPPNLLKKMVSAGWLGRKTRKGFYEDQQMVSSDR